MFTVDVKQQYKNSNNQYFVFGMLTVKTKIAEFAKSVDLDEVAYDEPPQLDLHCLPSSL